MVKEGSVCDLSATVLCEIVVLTGRDKGGIVDTVTDGHLIQ